jgi:uracil-DNA glycosylase
LGKVAFDNCIKFYKKNFLINKKLIFKHGVKYYLPDGKILIPSYHPSPRNVNTKVINKQKMMSLLKMAKRHSKL